MIQLGISHTDAYFETVSGLTTTGSTVLSNLDTLPMSINLWRHQLVWVGGMGLIVLAIAILPLLGIGGRQMFKAETPGPMKDSKMTPRIAETAKGLWLVYLRGFRGLHRRLPLGRHDLVRRGMPRLLDNGLGRLLDARCQLSAFSIPRPSSSSGSSSCCLPG